MQIRPYDAKIVGLDVPENVCPTLYFPERLSPAPASVEYLGRSMLVYQQRCDIVLVEHNGVYLVAEGIQRVLAGRWIEDGNTEFGGMEFKLNARIEKGKD